MLEPNPADHHCAGTHPGGGIDERLGPDGFMVEFFFRIGKGKGCWNRAFDLGPDLDGIGIYHIYHFEILFKPSWQKLIWFELITEEHINRPSRQ